MQFCYYCSLTENGVGGRPRGAQEDSDGPASDDCSP